MASTKRDNKSLVPVKETIETQNPVVLASGNEAVAGVADKLIKMSPAQRTFLRLRFYYDTDIECARAIGISSDTVNKWKRKDEFVAVYNELLTQPVLHARAELVLLTNKAIDTLAQLLDSPAPTVRLSAAEKILKSRDTQLLTNSVKVEGSDGDDLYVALMKRLSTRQKIKIEEPAEEGDTVEAEFCELPPEV